MHEKYLLSLNCQYATCVKKYPFMLLCSHVISYSFKCLPCLHMTLFCVLFYAEVALPELFKEPHCAPSSQLS